MLKNKKFILLFLSLISGLLLSISWPERGFPGFLFIALVPLLFIEDYIRANKTYFIRFSVFFYSYPAFFLWNGLTTWWIFNSTGIGAIMAVVLNALFMAIIFQAFHYSRLKLNHALAGYASLLFYWIAFEYLHLNWELNWPWLNLGNGFASYYKWVQWYEYTGALGGTLWVLLANILFYRLFQASGFKLRVNRLWLAACILWLSMILVPVLISYIIYNRYTEKKNPVHVVVVQPNIDPYKEQYTVPPVQVIGRIMELAAPVLDSSTNFLIAPESAIQQEMWENDLDSFQSIIILKQIVSKYNHLNLLVGGSTYYAFSRNEKVPHTARKFSDNQLYYNRYNTAILINSTHRPQLYHKSKLTPGVESLPSYKGFRWLENYAIDLGGIVGSLGTDSVRKVYQSDGTVPIGPIICYESIFGEFFAEFVRNGAEVMFIITNDGWWGNTAGYRQHYSFAHLRAIETRRSIARSANTGISAFIDQRGDASLETKYWEPAVIKGTVNANSDLTFYVKHGDYIARIAIICALIAMAGSITMSFINRR
jgi:apolipoprotein N-acyltransferase